MKRIQALVAACLITGLVAFGMLVIGAAVLFNPGNVVANAAPASDTANVTSPDPQSPSQISQLQNLITQYQNREKQYQAQINQLNQQYQNDESILNALQQRGLIRINPDGSVQLLSRGGRDGR
jgi:hypothetical protein